jgi:nitrogen fixation/metabolism regulation signal transduction histidine kinase
MKGKRRIQNYLLAKRFQLKYTLLIVFITSILSIFLGSLLYNTHKENSEIILSATLSDSQYRDPALLKQLEKNFKESDTKVLYSLIGLLVAFVLLLTILGIFITHRIAGPVYRMKKICERIGTGDLSIDGRLRKRDELKDLFESLSNMVVCLRNRKEEELKVISRFLENIEEEPEVRERFQSHIDSLKRLFKIK